MRIVSNGASPVALSWPPQPSRPPLPPSSRLPAPGPQDSESPVVQSCRFETLSPAASEDFIDTFACSQLVENDTDVTKSSLPIPSTCHQPRVPACRESQTEHRSQDLWQYSDSAHLNLGGSCSGSNICSSHLPVLPFCISYDIIWDHCYNSSLLVLQWTLKFFAHLCHCSSNLDLCRLKMNTES
jgi:hypothetical protein